MEPKIRPHSANTEETEDHKMASLVGVTAQY